MTGIKTGTFSDVTDSNYFSLMTRNSTTHFQFNDQGKCYILTFKVSLQMLLSCSLAKNLLKAVIYEVPARKLLCNSATCAAFRLMTSTSLWANTSDTAMLTCQSTALSEQTLSLSTELTMQGPEGLAL